VTRERLVASARTLLYEQGVERTTIAEIAEAADVPPGNVYYHFKTKDRLIEAQQSPPTRATSSTCSALSSDTAALKHG
jgi:TetR/AcrR family transcriptional repressor of nem operon